MNLFPPGTLVRVKDEWENRLEYREHYARRRLTKGQVFTYLRQSVLYSADYSDLADPKTNEYVLCTPDESVEPILLDKTMEDYL